MESFKFNGKVGEYFKICATNVFLTIITFSLYYPFAKVRSNRYIFNNIVLETHCFGYSATGKDFFLSYFIKFTLFIPLAIAFIFSAFFSVASAHALYLLVFLATLFLVSITLLPLSKQKYLFAHLNMICVSDEKLSFTGKLSGAYFNFISHIFWALLVFAFLIIKGLFKTSFAALSSHFCWKKSALELDLAQSDISLIFFKVFFILFLTSIVIISLVSLVFVLKEKKQISYIVNNLTLGEKQFTITLLNKKMMVLVAKTLLLLVMLLFPLALFFYDSNFFEVTCVVTFEKKSSLFPLLSLLPVFISTQYYIARKRQYIFKQIRLSETIKFKSTLRARDLIWVSVSNVVLIIFSLGLAAPWAKIRITKLKLENTYLQRKDSPAY